MAEPYVIEWTGSPPYDAVFVARRQLLHPSETGDWWIVDTNWDPYETVTTLYGRTYSEILSHPCRIPVVETGGPHSLQDPNGPLVGAFAYQIVQCYGGSLAPFFTSPPEDDPTDSSAFINEPSIYWPEIEELVIEDGGGVPRFSLSFVPYADLPGKTYNDAKYVEGADFPDGLVEVKGRDLVFVELLRVNDLRENTIEWVP